MDMSKLYEETALRSAALLAINLVFIVEFNFTTSRLLHLVALCFFAASTPLLAVVVVAAQFWKSGERFERATRDYHHGPATMFGSGLTIAAIGLCIWSYSWIPGIIYFFFCLFAAHAITIMSGVDPK